MEKEYFEDYKIGEKFVTPARTITEADIVLFAAFSGDWHPIHTDCEYAKKTIFSERIAHGLLGLVVGSGLAFRLGAQGALPKKFIAFYGMDNLRFTAQLRIGDTIHVEIEVIDLISKKENRGIVHFRSKLINQRGEVVNVHESKILVAGRPKDKDDPTVERR